MKRCTGSGGQRRQGFWRNRLLTGYAIPHLYADGMAENNYFSHGIKKQK